MLIDAPVSALTTCMLVNIAFNEAVPVVVSVHPSKSN